MKSTKQKIKENMIAGLSITFIIAVVILGIYWEIDVWNECRNPNSFWYCMRVLSK